MKITYIQSSSESACRLELHKIIDNEFKHEKAMYIADINRLSYALKYNNKMTVYSLTYYLNSNIFLADDKTQYLDRFDQLFIDCESKSYSIELIYKLKPHEAFFTGKNNITDLEYCPKCNKKLLPLNSGYHTPEFDVYFVHFTCDCDENVFKSSSLGFNFKANGNPIIADLDRINNDIESSIKSYSDEIDRFGKPEIIERANKLKTRVNVLIDLVKSYTELSNECKLKQQPSIIEKKIEGYTEQLEKMIAENPDIIRLYPNTLKYVDGKIKFDDYSSIDKLTYLITEYGYLCYQVMNKSKIRQDNEISVNNIGNVTSSYLNHSTCLKIDATIDPTKEYSMDVKHCNLCKHCNNTDEVKAEFCSKCGKPYKELSVIERLHLKQTAPNYRNGVEMFTKEEFDLICDQPKFKNVIKYKDCEECNNFGSLDWRSYCDKHQFNISSSKLCDDWKCKHRYCPDCEIYFKQWKCPNCGKKGVKS